MTRSLAREGLVRLWSVMKDLIRIGEIDLLTANLADPRIRALIVVAFGRIRVPHGELYV